MQAEGNEKLSLTKVGPDEAREWVKEAIAGVVKDTELVCSARDGWELFVRVVCESEASKLVIRWGSGCSGGRGGIGKLITGPRITCLKYVVK